MTPNNPEVGRELLASDLEPRTVVVLMPAWNTAQAITSWVEEVMPTAVLFGAGVVQIHLLLLRTADDTLSDTSGRRVHVFEYLGEV